MSQTENQVELSGEDKEKSFLTDTSEKTVWTKTNSGHKCPMNLIQMLAPNYSSKLNDLNDKETVDLFGYTYKYYAPKDDAGNIKPDSNKMIYRFAPKAGGGGKPQFRPKRTKEVFEGLFPEVQMILSKPDSKWKLFATHFNPSDSTVIYVLQQEESIN